MDKKNGKRPLPVLIPLISQTIGALNDNAMQAMLPIMAAFQFGKESMDQTNQIVSLLLIIPFVVFAPWAGWVSDLFSKKRWLLIFRSDSWIRVLAYSLLTKI